MKFIPLLLFTMLLSCEISYAQVDISESYSHDSKAKEFKLILLNPGYEVINTAQFTLEDFEYQTKQHKSFIKYLNKFSKKNNIQIEIIDDSHEKYWSDLLTLSNVMLLSNVTQNHPLDNKRNYGQTYSYTQKVLAQPPTIDANYSKLSREFGTPYFAICKWLYVADEGNIVNSYTNIDFGRKNSVFYLIIFDVIKGEVVYRDIRSYSFKGGKSEIFPVIYEVFYLLNKNLNQ